jgi:Flp pilus assembly protein TadG
MVKILATQGYSGSAMEMKDLRGGSGIYISEAPESITIDVTPHSIEPWQFRSAPANSVLMTNESGTVEWVFINDALKTMVAHPTIRDRLEKLIQAQKDLEMTIKLVTEDENSR